MTGHVRTPARMFQRNVYVFLSEGSGIALMFHDLNQFNHNTFKLSYLRVSLGVEPNSWAKHRLK